MSVRTEDLHKHFGEGHRRVDVLRGISVAIDSETPVAVIGPSGCGKSTFLHCIGTLTRPSEGKVLIDGQDAFQLSEPELARFRNRSVGFIFQDHHLLPQYSVIENVLLPAMAFPSDSDSSDRASELLERVGLSHRLHHQPAQLSGGERQRVAVARALLNRPSLLLCDEPTGNLDQETATTVAELLFDLHRQEQNTLVVVTHSRELAARFPRRLDLREGTCFEA